MGSCADVPTASKGGNVIIEASSEFTAEELLSLYDDVGWSAYTADPQRLLAAIDGSTHVVVAREDGLLVGLARVVSDGVSICFLQDVLVRRAFQRRGVGGALVRAVLEPFGSVRQKVLLTDDEPAQRAFYQSLGYREIGEVDDARLRAFVRFDIT
jgi:GNAT superfamily N-acetyltransferase